jgi:phytanoyl-CoA hydroxylase
MRDYKLKQSDIDFYNENGYLIINGLYSEDFTERYLSAIRRHANNDFAAIINPDRYDTLYELDERPKSNLTIDEITDTVELSKMVFKNKTVIKILRTLQGKDVVGLSTQMIFKEAYSSYASQAWAPHQDNRYIDNENGQYITTNWFMRESTPENGGIYVYPGSHRLPLLPAPDKKSYRENPDDNPGRECEIPDEFKDKKVDLITKPSSVVFLHGNTIHGSYGNESNKSRPWFSCCYITKGEKYNIGYSSKRIEVNFE